MTHVVLFLLAAAVYQAHMPVATSLLLNETFDTLDNWIEDKNGITAVIEIEPDRDHGGSGLFTNITYCPTSPSAPCYRAELATPQSARQALFPSCTVEYWLGFSSYIPENWKWVDINSAQDVIYNFQLHGGDNTGNSPMLGIRVAQGEMQANICGNSEFSSSSSTCEYFKLGSVSLGSWVDFVINSQLAYGNPTGFVKIWRNGKLMVSAANILTSYNDMNPPYMKVGSYVTDWADNLTTGYNWSSVWYTSLKLGDASSSYDEVYTGSGATCGSACDIFGSDDDNSIRIDQTAVFIVTLPLGAILLCSAVLYCAHLDQKKAYADGLAQMKPRRKKVGNDGSRSSRHSSQRVSEVSSNNFKTASAMGESLIGVHTSSTAFRSSVSQRSSALSNLSRLSGLIWEDEVEFLNIRDPAQVEREGSSYGDEWRSGRLRMIAWYVFGYSIFVGMFIIALLLYGRPVAGTRGALPWKYIHNWNIYQATMIIVSLVMVSIYFLPLLFIRHDFEAGRKFENDPFFLRRIGVVIPCHKSAGEIGEVIRRVLKYIPPENIVVCDNGNFDGPVDATFEVVKAQHRKIRYCFIKQGHKTRALWTGAQRLPSHVEYIMHLDDDTHISDTMVFDESHFTSAYNKDHVIAVAFLRSSEKLNKVTNFTDFWYKITDHFHGTQAYITTRCFVPGPAGLWRRSKFIEVFSAHPALPFGEDIFGGFTTLNKGYAIRSEMRCMVKTFAPPILVNWGTGGRAQGYGAASIWKQRAHRWTVSALRITGKSLYSFFTYNSRGGIFSNIAFRLYRFREYKIILVQLFYIPFCIVIMARGFYFEFIVLKLMLFALPLLRNLFINYVCWRGKPELQVDFETVLLSPFFNFFLIMCAVHGRLKCILWYIPNVPPNHGMLQRCCPRPYAEVNCDEIDVEESDYTIAGHTEKGVDYSKNVTVQSEQRVCIAGSTKTELQELSAWKSIAEKHLNSRDDVYELFDRDGSSSIVVYCADDDEMSATTADIMAAARYEPPAEDAAEGISGAYQQ